jgi:hypothetical protein
VAAGDAAALVGTSLTALVSDSLDSSLVRALWVVVRDGGSLDEALAVLGQLGFSHLCDFVMLSWEGEQCRVVVRGQVGAEIYDPSGELTQSVNGAAVLSWAEHTVSDAGSVRIRMGKDLVDEALFNGQQIVGGLVVASALEIVAPTASADSSAFGSKLKPEEDPSPAQEEQQDASAEVASAAVHEEQPEPPAVEAEEDVAASSAERSADPFHAWSTSSNPQDALLVDSGEDPEVQSEPATLSGSEEATIFEPPEKLPPDLPSLETAPEAAEPAAYDDLFGATQFRSVESAAVRVEDAAGMVESVPKSHGGGSITLQDSDHDGKTITVEELRRMQAGSSGASIAAATTGISGEFLAVSCAAGHLNPPHGDACRVCGQVIHTQKPSMVSAINLGNFRFSTGITVPVTRSMVIGRSPKVSGAVDGQVPELVSVPSPSQDISRNHVEVHVEGWQVLVVDKGSTNGTVVILPNRDPQRLRPDEPFPLSIGARVSLADEVDFVFEVPE